MLTIAVLKAASWDDINFRFLFCNEEVYPTDHYYFFYWIFRFIKIFFTHTFMNPTVTQTNFLYTQAPARGRLNVPTALGHMLMPSAQRLADIWCCGGTPLISPFSQQLRAAVFFSALTLFFLYFI